MQIEGAPPNDQDAKRAVIGALLQPKGGAEAIVKVLQIGLRPEHFYNKNTNRKIYQAIIRLHQEGTPADLFTVSAAERLDKQAIADDMGYEIERLRDARPLDLASLSRPEPVDGESFLAVDHPPVPMLVGRGMVPACGYTILGGYAKAGKTTLAFQMAICIVTGTPFMGRFPIEKQGARVLYCYSRHRNDWLILCSL